MTWTILDSGTDATTATPNWGSGHSYSFPGGAANANDLLTVCVSSDTTVSTPSGWSLAVSDIGNIGAYIFYKLATGGETAVTITTSGNFPTAIAFIRYGGSATASPLDKTAAARSTSFGAATPTATTATLTGTGELSLAAGCLGGLSGAAQTGITWSTGYTGRLNQATAGTGSTDQRILVADKYTAGTTAESANVSWTNSTNNQTQLIATFKAAPAAAGYEPQILSQYGAFF